MKSLSASGPATTASLDSSQRDGLAMPNVVDLATLFAGAATLYALIALAPLWNVPLLGDAVDYFTTAANRWKTGVQEGPNYWPPGVPLALYGVFSVFGRASESLAQGTSLVCTAVTGCFVYLAALELAVGRRVALWAAVCFYAYPTTVLMARQTETHVFCALYIAAGAYFLIRFLKSGQIRYSVLLAGAFGLLLLTRPGSAALFIVCVGTPMLMLLPSFSRSALQACRPNLAWHTLIVGLGTAAIVAPFVHWNLTQGGGMTISTNNERNFFLGNNKFTHSYKTGHLAWHDLASFPEPTQRYLREVYNSEQPRQAMMKESIAYIQSNPGQFAIRTFNRLKNFWAFDYESGRRIQREGAAYGRVSWIPMIAQAVCSVLLIGAFFGCLPSLYGTRHGLPALTILIACLLYQLPHLLAFSSPVYRAGLTPLICIAVAMGLSAASRRPKPGTDNKASISHQRTGLAYFLVVGLVLAYINVEAAYYLLLLS
jgi:hypothetical protein